MPHLVTFHLCVRLRAETTFLAGPDGIDVVVSYIRVVELLDVEAVAIEHAAHALSRDHVALEPAGRTFVNSAGEPFAEPLYEERIRIDPPTAVLHSERERTAAAVVAVSVLENGEGYLTLARAGDEDFRVSKAIAKAPASISHLLGRVIWNDGDAVYCGDHVIGRRDERGRVAFVTDRDFRAALGLDRPR